MSKYPLLLCCLFLFGRLPGQCPDKAALWKRLEFLRGNPSISPADQLKELLPSLGEMKKCHYQDDSTYAFLLQRIGMAYHLMKDDEQAGRYMKTSIPVITANIDMGRTKPDQLVRSYYNLSVIYDSLGLIPEANNALDSFITMAIRTGFPSLVPVYNALADRAMYCYDAGDYKQCIAYSDMLGLLKPSSDTVVNKIKDAILTHRLNALLALQYYDSAEQLLTVKMQTAKKERDVNSLGALYGIAANIALGKGLYSVALADFRREFDYRLKNKDTRGCAVALNATGYVYSEKLHDAGNALRYYRKALTFYNKTEALSIFDNIALLYAGKNQYDSTFYYFGKAFGQIAPGTDETDLLRGSLTRTVDNIAEYVTGLVLDKADICLQKYNQTKDSMTLIKALAVYKATDRLLNRLKMEQADFASRLFWRRNSHRLYEHAIRAAYAQADPANVFYFLEKSRAVLLNDQLFEQRLLANEDILKEAQLKKNILYLEKIIPAPGSDSLTMGQIRSDLFFNRQALSALEGSIRKRNPLYFRHFIDTAFLTLPDLQNFLRKDHQSLLELYGGDSAIYTLLVTADHSYLNRIGKTDFDSSANAFLFYLSDPSRLNRDMPGYIRTAHHLYDILFPHGAIPDGRIIISPDDRYFPFEALVSGNSLQNPEYFLYAHPTCYTYSAGYLIYTAVTADSSNTWAQSSNNQAQSPNTQTQSSATRIFMGMAPIRYDPALHLPSLQGSDHALDQIGTYFSNPDEFISGRASKNNFLQNFSRYRLIQLYTHAIGNSPAKEPVIYFADSALYLSELIPESTPATRLIVLSACESGKGEFYRGEGIFSFNREFAALGIPAAIVNLWSVENTATYGLTELFYKYLSRGDPTDLALQKAKKEWIQTASGDQRLPYYWAAPILTGSPASLIQNKASGDRTIFVEIAIIFLLLYAAFRFTISRRKNY
jgi:tetratricopeptide (TPR) repeat protein